MIAHFAPDWIAKFAPEYGAHFAPVLYAHFTPESSAQFDRIFHLDIIGEAIKQARKERHLTQEELGRLVGVKKAQISKIENSLTDARFETIMKVFKALNAKIHFNIELLDQKMTLA